MYLKEIQTLGFKSFADKLNFEFTNNINGIVGPNGSGKSNVVDAIRWVLGEQSNKQLRTDNNTSFIFSGSKSRRPLNSAMVNLIFDNSDRHLPIDYSEVSIKRVMYRSGENEYYLNGAKCRLKDISDLLTDSGAARESFNIIGQGKIDEILSTKPVDRRIIFEEASGVLKYKKRKEEALRKIDRTNVNLNRINDIIYELEGNLRPLEEQSNAAKKYNNIKDNLTNKEISLIIYDIDNYSKIMNECKSKISSLSDEISLLNTNNANYDINLLTYKDKFSMVNKEIEECHKLIMEKTKILDEVDADIRILRERKKYINKESDMDVSKLIEDKLSRENELNNLVNDKNILSKKNDNIKYKLNELNHLKDEFISNINKIKNNINSNNMSITDLEYKISALEDNINNGYGMPTSVKSILNNPKFSDVYTVGSLLETDNEYSLALSTSLGAAVNYLVVDTKGTASKLINYLKSNGLGRATFLPLDVMRGRYIDTDIIDGIKKIDGYVDILINKVKYDTEYQNIMLNQLGTVILAKDIDSANEISKFVNHKYKVVTLDGQVVNVGGSITGGDKIKSNDSIRLKYELDEYKNSLISKSIENENYKLKLEEYGIKLDDISNNMLEMQNEFNINLDYIKNKDNNISNLSEEIKKYEKEIKDIDTIKNDNSDIEEKELINRYYDIKNEISSLESRISSLKIDYDKINADILEIEDISKKDNEHIDALEKELKEYELKVSRVEIRMDDALNSLNEDYTITYNEAKNKYKLEGNPDDYRKEVSNLKNQLKDIGVVNLGAISEYERVSERYNFLIKQKDDLNGAIDTLNKIINDMDNIMKEKFVSTFNDIRIEFKKVFKELFKGGNADIFMTDPDNILETGIDIEATPPGKSLKNIQSLSGGERTFTAISLLFAILNVRPVPFCVFDEVEAALDDANVDAFGEYLDKYRDKTQFILITHKKKTMEFINTLYGITMQESGVSKLVSVKLDEVK